MPSKNIYLDEKVLKKVEDQATKDERSVSYIINSIVKKAFNLK